MNNDTLKVGDTVAIRGDKCWNYQLNKCKYFPEQLVDGKYIKHTGTGKVWTAKITKFLEDGTRAALDIGAGSWAIDLLEKYES
jgi:hypothetical protein